MTLKANKPLHPTAFVVFGATGDLTQRKLYPTLYALSKRNLLPKELYLYGLAREPLTDAQFKKEIEKEIKAFTKGPYDQKAIARLLKRVKYFAADLSDRESFQALEDDIRAEEKKIGHGIQRLFYLALPPELFPQVAKNVESCRMGKALCTNEQVLSRIIVEKPFGYDLRGAQKLDKELHEVFREQQIFRIDHYLGKEPMQNILFFRFGNTFFEEHWNAKHIARIQINALEEVGLEKRFAYYDGAGAIRDMLQNHLLQFLAYLTMDEPKELTPAQVRASKAALLSKVAPDRGTPLVTAQYAGYRSEKGVPRSTKTETYFATKLAINTPRWKGVPVYIRSGKHLGRKETSAIIEFKDRTNCCLVANPKMPLVKNRIQVQIAPVPSISLGLNVHALETDFGAEYASMHYCPAEAFTDGMALGDYERLLIEIMNGEQFLFSSSEEVMASWRAVEPLMAKAKRMKPQSYKKGSLGPKDAELLADWMEPIMTCSEE